MSSSESYTFDEVVRLLKINPMKLKRLVSEGEVNAFREDDIMKFKKSEIDKLIASTPDPEGEVVLQEITLESETDLPDDGADKVGLFEEGELPSDDESSRDDRFQDVVQGDDVSLGLELEDDLPDDKKRALTSSDFYTFDEVLRILKVTANKLKRLVKEGELSAFREGDIMKFKKSEIDRLAADKTSETLSDAERFALEDKARKWKERFTVILGVAIVEAVVIVGCVFF